MEPRGGLMARSRAQTTLRRSPGSSMENSGLALFTSRNIALLHELGRSGSKADAALSHCATGVMGARPSYQALWEESRPDQLIACRH